MRPSSPQFRKLKPSTDLQRFRAGLALVLGNRVQPPTEPARPQELDRAKESHGQVEPAPNGPARQPWPVGRYGLTDPTPARGRELDTDLGLAPARHIAISTRVMAIVGDAAAALVLSQLLYWTRRGVDVVERDGWIFKTCHEWQHETGMSWKIQRRARQHLLAIGLIDERKLHMPARLEYRVRLGELGAALADGLNLGLPAIDLVTWRSSDGLIEQLLGRGFAFQTRLAHVFPLHTAMLCSRLMSGQRWPGNAGQAAAHPGMRPGAQALRFVSLSRQAWHREAGLSRDQWQTARRNLKAAGVLVERPRNYPRRVDLAIDPVALAGWLDEARRGGRASGTAQRPYRLDRAKQLGGIGRHPILPAESPDPTYRDRPIQPTGIAQSSLYLLGLQGLSQLQHPATGWPNTHKPITSIPAFGWGGGGGYERAKQPEEALQGSATARLQPEPTEAAKLIWPSGFTDGDKPTALRHLGQLTGPQQQLVLDEIGWLQQCGKTVRSPVALVRTLSQRCREGTFHPEGAHRIDGARQAAKLEAQAAAAKARELAADPSDGKAQPKAERSPEIVARIEALLGRRRQA